MLKEIGSQYVIIGHSEKDLKGETDIKVNKKIKSCIESGI